MFASACNGAGETYYHSRRYYFGEHPIALADLYAEAESWLGTPFRHQCGVKGKGADCIHFVISCLESAGALQGRVAVIPAVSKDWHLHEKSAPILKTFFERQVPCVGVEKGDLQDGDTVMFKFGHHIAHCGIYLNRFVYQSLEEIGVEKRKMSPVCFKHIYRIVSI